MVTTLKDVFGGFSSGNIGVGTGVLSSQFDSVERVRESYETPTGNEYPSKPENPNWTAQNENLRQEFHVYLNTDGRYELEAGYKDIYSKFGMTSDQIKDCYYDAMMAGLDGYQDADGPEGEVYEAQKKVCEDIALYNKAHDPAYLSSLDQDGLNSFMQEYLEWEQAHTYTETDENGVSVKRYTYGCTAEEYQAMTMQEQAAMVGTWSNTQEKFGDGLADAVAAVQAQNEPVTPVVLTGPEDGETAPSAPETPQSGSGGSAWGNVKSKITNVMAAARDMLASSAIGSWVIEKVSYLRDRFFGKEDAPMAEPEAETGTKYDESDFSFLQDEDGPGPDTTVTL